MRVWFGAGFSCWGASLSQTAKAPRQRDVDSLSLTHETLGTCEYMKPHAHTQKLKTHTEGTHAAPTPKSCRRLRRTL